MKVPILTLLITCYCTAQESGARMRYQDVERAFDADPRSKPVKYADYRLQMQRIANAEEQHEEGRRALIWLFRNSWWERADGTMYSSAESAGEKLLWLHMDSDDLGAIVRYRHVLGRKDRTGFQRRLLDFSPHKDVRGLACFGLGRDRIFSRDDQTRAEGRTYLERVIKEFADVGYHRVTLGDMARAALGAYPPDRVAVGREAPEVVGIDQEGERRSSRDYAGKILVLVFWEPGCKPCRSAYGLGDELRNIAGARCSVLGVCGAPDPGAIRETMQKRLFSWPSILDGGLVQGPIATRWRVNLWPTTIVIGPDGRIRGLPRSVALVPQIVEAIAKESADGKKQASGLDDGKRKEGGHVSRRR